MHLSGAQAIVQMDVIWNIKTTKSSPTALLREFIDNVNGVFEMTHTSFSLCRHLGSKCTCKPIILYFGSFFMQNLPVNSYN